jgi:hypothetical protein
MFESAMEEAESVLLALASALLFEELTLGGLVKLITAPKSKSRTNDQNPHRREDGGQPESSNVTSRPA